MPEPGPTSPGSWIGAGPGPFPHCGGTKGSSQSQCARVTEVLSPSQPLPGKFPLGTSSGGYFGPDSRPYGLWNLTTGGKAGPEGVISCGAGPMEGVEWMQRQPNPEDLRVGLINWAGSYLTYEPYKNMVTTTAKGLGRRQVTE